MPQKAGPALELDVETFRQIGHSSVDLAADYLASLQQRPVFCPMTPEERQHLLEETLSEEGIAPEDLLCYIRDYIFTHPMGNGHPRFFGWTASTPHPLGAIADFLAAILNPNCVGGDHSATYLELTTIRWLMDLLHFPSEGSMGLLVDGGSMATLTALAVARHHATLQDGWNDREQGLQQHHPPFTIYLSDEAHSSASKAVELLGLGTQAIRIIATDADFRMNTDHLRTTIQADRAAGLRPFCVVASTGTINTGAIDPIDTIADICDEENLWLHIDGSLGAIGILDHSLFAQFKGMDRAHSLSFDPHKALSVPFECACVFIRDKNTVHDTFNTSPAYLHVKEGKSLSGLLWFSEYGIQLSRGFRALKLWMILQALGRQNIVRRIVHYHVLARLLARFIEDDPDFALMASVSLSVVCFRSIPSFLAMQEDGLEQLNRDLVPLVQESGETFVSSTVLRGKFVLRACILHETTTEEDIVNLLESIRRKAYSILAK